MPELSPEFPALQQDLARSLVSALSASPLADAWWTAELTHALVGARRQTWLRVQAEDGAELPADVVELPVLDGRWERLKRAAADPELGTWLVATLRVDRAGAVDTRFVHDEPVHLGDHAGAPAAPWADGTGERFPTAEDYRREFASFPRAERAVPEWAREFATAPDAATASLGTGPRETDFGGLHAVGDYAGLYHALRQDLFDDLLAERLGEYTFEGDLDEGRISFVSTTNGQRIDTRATLLASVAPGVGSLLWGWAHPQGAPDGPAAAVRELGERHGIDDLTSPELALPSHDDEEARGAIATTVAAVAGNVGVEANGISPAMLFPVGGGTVTVFQLTGIDLPEPTFADFMVRGPRLLSSVPMRDHRAGFIGLAARRGWILTWDDPGRTSGRMSEGADSAALTFDPSGRLTNLHVSRRSVPDPT